MDIKILEERKRNAGKVWDDLKARIDAGEKLDKNEISAAMQRCNDCDKAFIDLRMKDYLKKRETWLQEPVV